MTDNDEIPACILVVDDSRVMLRSAQKILDTHFTVITAADGEDAWDCLIRNEDIQVIFSDLNMPRCGGFELLKRIRSSSNPSMCDLPLIIVTGNDDDEVARQHALDLGATDFIVKPFTSTDLLARARAHVEHRRTTRRLLADSRVDSLTGLANESGFTERLQKDISYAQRHQQTTSLMRVEIVDLQATASAHGQGTANQLAQQVSSLILGRIRKEDTAAYLGAGHFAISLPGGHSNGVANIASYLQTQLAQQPLVSDGKTIATELRIAVVNSERRHWSNAKDALDQSQALFDSETGMQEAMHGAFTDETTSPEPLRLDALIEQIRLGHTQEAIDKMPLALQQLLPLLRLMSGDQRTHLTLLLDNTSSS